MDAGILAASLDAIVIYDGNNPTTRTNRDTTNTSGEPAAERERLRDGGRVKPDL
jgi:hypothetical protein